MPWPGLLCVPPAFAADDEEPKGVSVSRRSAKLSAIPSPLRRPAESRRWMSCSATVAPARPLPDLPPRAAFRHRRQVRLLRRERENATPCPVATTASPELLFKAFHAKDSDHSCYGCHMKKRKQYTGFQKGCLPCHEKAQKDPKAPAVAEKTLN